MITITNTDSIIDSRDIIERIEELEASLRDEFEAEDSPLTFEEYIEVTHFEDDTDAYEYKTLLALAEQCKDYADDWEYGVGLLHEDYFEEYADEMLEDCGEIPKNLPFYISITVDYDALKQDYTEVDFNGETYYIR